VQRFLMHLVQLIKLDLECRSIVLGVGFFL
jgi:hypothetical protein